MTPMMKMSFAILVLSAVPVFAQAAAPPALQKAVSVQMAVTLNAASMPEADDSGAWVVAVTADNKLFFGPDPVSREELANIMKSISHKLDAKLYIKADARAQFSSVRDVMDLGHQAAFAASVFLTSQREYVAPGTVAPPKGLLIAPPPGSEEGSVVLGLFAKSGAEPVTRVNNQIIPPGALQTVLTQILQGRTDKMIILKADGRLPFSEIARVVDLCKSPGAQVAIP
jgi:biopolymer transport protein ExbD